MRLWFRTLTLATAVAVLLAGCQALDVQYEEATLGEALKGQIVSKTHRYDIPKPPIAAVRRNTGIIREESLFVVIVGPSLKDVVEEYEGKDVRYGVRLVKDPMTYLVLEKVFNGDEKIDLFEGTQGFRLELPELVSYQDIDVAQYTPLPPAELATATPGPYLLSKWEVEKKKLPEELVGPAEALPDGGRTDRARYFLTSEDGALLETHAEAMTMLMLDFLIAEHKKLEGGVRIGDPFPAKVRSATNVVAPADIRWLQLGGAMYYKAH